jgi:membrane-associated protein
VGSFTYAGYAFGDLPVVQENFTLLIFGIIIVSVTPVVIEAMKVWRASRSGS